MKIGILGSGQVGQTLAGGFLRSGHEVKLGTRDIPKLDDWLKKTNNPKASTGSFGDTASFGEVLILAVHGMSALDAIDIAGKGNFKGKVVIDVTNPLDFSGGVPPKFVSAPGNSLAEKIQNHIPEARVIKAFNIVNCLIMVDPKREEGTPDMFIAGSDADAKKWVSELALSWGWNSCNDLGSLSEAYLIEAFAMLWIKYGFVNNNWTHAFRLMKK